MSTLRIAQVFILGVIAIMGLAFLTAVILVVAGPDWLPITSQEPTAIPEVVAWATALPTRTHTPVLPSPTLTPSPPPKPTPTPTAVPSTPTPTVPPAPSATPIATPSPFPSPPPPADPPTPSRPPLDFVVVHQRMRTNEENSWDGKVANNCGGDHTIYVQVIDAAGQPLTGVIIGDTYRNVRASSGTAGPGQLAIQLWSNTMSLEVQGQIDGTPYTSESTVPLSTRDEDIPTEWLFAGGYCESIANCQLRQQTNGLCRGHYSYDVTFQRTW